MNSSISSENSNAEENKENINQISINLGSLNLDLIPDNPLKTVETKSNNASKSLISLNSTIESEIQINAELSKTLVWEKKSYDNQHPVVIKKNLMNSKENRNEKILPFSSYFMHIKNQKRNSADQQKRQEWYFLKFETDYVNNLQVIFFCIII